MEAVSEGVQLNRESFSERFDDMGERIGDAVKRVNATRQEVSRVESTMASNAEVGRVQAETLATVQETLQNAIEDEREKSREAEENLLEKVEEIRREQQRTISDKAQDTIELAVEKTKSVITGFQ